MIKVICFRHFEGQAIFLRCVIATKVETAIRTAVISSEVQRSAAIYLNDCFVPRNDVAAWLCYFATILNPIFFAFSIIKS